MAIIETPVMPSRIVQVTPQRFHFKGIASPWYSNKRSWVTGSAIGGCEQTAFVAFEKAFARRFEYADWSLERPFLTIKIEALDPADKGHASFEVTPVPENATWVFGAYPITDDAPMELCEVATFIGRPDLSQLTLANGDLSRDELRTLDLLGWITVGHELWCLQPRH